MPFIKDILKHRSLSIVGLEKNTGKTVCLNYILHRLNDLGASVGVTSIGVDGEQVDSVFATAKPEITLYEGTRFITSEKHYLMRQTVSVLESVDSLRTSLGPLVTARVLVRGKALLSLKDFNGRLASLLMAVVLRLLSNRLSTASCNIRFSLRRITSGALISMSRRRRLLRMITRR